MIEVQTIIEKNPRYAIGLMSGSSADGVDAALVRLKGTGKTLAMKLIHHDTFPYAPSLKTRLLSEHLSVKDVCMLNFELGEQFALAARAMIEDKTKAEQSGCDEFLTKPVDFPRLQQQIERLLQKTD